MKLQVLVATMNRSDLSFAEGMNLRSDALIINQTPTPPHEISCEIEGGTVRMLSFDQRGLSRSRNQALGNADGDICLISDDDMTYYDDYAEKILNAYKENPEYDIIAFTFVNKNASRNKHYSDKPYRVDYLHSMKISSVEITFKRRSFEQAGLQFNEHFGTGSGKYSMGEENILLFNALKKGLKILFVPVCIGEISCQESSWFSGWTKRFLYDKGAMFYEMSHLFSFPLILQCAIRKYPLYKENTGFFGALKELLRGRRQRKKEIKN